MKTNSISCKNYFFTKLTHNHGISLITLVITIVVVIILAAAVILSLNNNNVLTNSRVAVNANDFSEVQSAWSIALQGVIAKQLDNVVLSGEITATGFAAHGWAGEKPSSTTAVTISQVAQNAAVAITISSMGLPASFTNIAIKDNVVNGIVKNKQLMYKDSEGTLRVMNANFTGTIEASTTAAESNLIKTGESYSYPAIAKV